MANILKLSDELKTALVDHLSVESPDGETYIIIAPNGDDITSSPEVQAVLAAFDETDYVMLRCVEAKSQIPNIPDWGDWTQAQFESYYQTEVADELALVTGFDQASLVALRAAVTGLGNIVYRGMKMLLYLRDIVCDTRGQQPD